MTTTVASQHDPITSPKPAKKGGDMTPYLAARREWNERYGSYIAQAKNWRVAFFIVLGVCALETAGLVVMGTQNKLIPYVVQVDKLGTPVAVGRADAAGKVDDRVIKAELARWISDVRGVVSDGIVQRQMVDRTYSKLSKGTRALTIVNEYFKGNPPPSRAQTEAVTADVSSVIAVSDKTWQVDWTETTRNTSGAVTGTVKWRAILTIALNPPTTDALIRVNPAGIYLVDLSWSQVL